MHLRKAGVCQGNEKSLRELGVEYLNLQTLCKTIIGLSSELSLVEST
jgi:hypothetical protein